MSLEASRFRLGLFFTLGSVLFVLAMIWLAGWFGSKSTETYACYFSESVQGLENGSTVRYNGVPVGEVKSINVAPDGRHVEVVMEIEEGFEVGDDLAARLDMTGITGLRVVNLRIPSPNEEVLGEIPFESRYRTIPVVKSSMETLEIALARLVEIMSEVDAAEISLQAVELMQNLNTILGDDSLDILIYRLNIAAARIDTLAAVYTDLGRDLDRIAVDTGSELPAFTEDVHMLAAELTALMAAITPMLEGLDEVLSEGNQLTAEMRQLMERMRDDPGDLLLSEPGGDTWP